ncbi:MAG: hypothetical protein VX405_05465 [Myxococcota bacterium]|nr:hypothetical protein [Myxococcales bacterium]MBF93536.1 hypothetical protein [Myxococcales bacterium]MEC7750941.1 hypothetical protein [Myxococcota bacterium]HBU46813.1 hypothetical protein [Myxococcales bacterium]
MMKQSPSKNPRSGERFNVLSPREYKGPDGEQRSAFTKVGVAFPLRHQTGFKIHLDAMPFHGELLILPANGSKESPS